jgi:hypothetical protein
MLKRGGGKGKGKSVGKDRGSSAGFFFPFPPFWGGEKQGALICFAKINGGR